MEVKRGHLVIGFIAYGSMLGAICGGLLYSTRVDKSANGYVRQLDIAESEIAELHWAIQRLTTRLEALEIQRTLSTRRGKIESVVRGMPRDKVIALLGEDYFPLPTNGKRPSLAWIIQEPFMNDEIGFQVDFDKEDKVKCARCYGR